MVIARGSTLLISDAVHRKLVAAATSHNDGAGTTMKVESGRSRRGDSRIQRGRPAPHIDSSDQPLLRTRQTDATAASCCAEEPTDTALRTAR
jgi:hypothetical protein